MGELINLETVLENSLQVISLKEILVILSFSMILSVILCTTYKFSNTTLTYNKKFSVTLAMVAFLSTVFMLIIKTNLMLSVGMLGALSIVRFRTNIKDTRDAGYIFWALCIGITSATNNYTTGIISSVIMSILMLVTSKEPKNSESLLLVVRGENTDIKLIQDIVNEAKGTSKIKAKNILSDSFELVYELKIAKDEDNKIIESLRSLDGIDSVNILAPNSEVI
ncbi:MULTISPECIES: DUF4956 domain-containing protein [Terrisporobacter]|uniref:DUF4956 domain-containing protein n=1 Tax=Terrisporobacter muris TaxID=2963284 RepID=A0A9X2MEM2_9FIRM|nr:MULTISPECIES: DUF4956 domain-containing protein [Terrisporobacter]MCC3668791.1 DUF4956 domain-containing protein [Terrisporobacter mayombei]MCR1824979.1 DUF4956 domain-containing protein [Terrisporobacter muris]MDU6983858.1 DUF4956 domain-containing protein [Terrisporobacter othiniensis]MDY3372507.1 DUF4956 domain-containing protein [Terrisporobacter othiniensis]